MIVILGGSGFIGQNILNSLKENGIKAKGTYFKNKKAGLEYFDLESMRPLDSSLFKEGARYLIIAAAVAANIDDSKKNWEKAYYVNVTKIKGIIDFCFQNSIVPVYISTDNVFDGEKGDYKETDERNPLNCYGKIKYEVENYLLSSDFEFIILRVGKVFGIKLDDNTLITSMIRDLREGKDIFCAEDQFFTPIYIQDLTDAIKKLIGNQNKGVFHLASIKATTRYTIAKTIRDYFRIKDANILPCKINSLNLIEKRPLLINLDCNKFNNMASFKQKDITCYLDLISEKNFLK